VALVAANLTHIALLPLCCDQNLHFQVFSASEHIECVRAQVMEKLGMALAFLGPGGNNVVILWVLAASF